MGAQLLGLDLRSVVQASAVSRENLGQVHGGARRILADLLAATEAVADQQVAFAGSAHRRQKHALGQRLRYLELVAFESEGSSHAAAAGVKQLHLGAGGTQKLHLVLHGAQGFLVAMAVDDNAASGQLRSLPVGGALCEYFAQHDGLPAQADGALVVGEEIDQFVAEDAGATGFEHDDRDSGGDLRFKLVQNTEQIAASLVEESEVVERSPAAYVPPRNLDAGSGGGEQFRC